MSICPDIMIIDPPRGGTEPCKKFEPITSPMMPGYMIRWTDALTAVNTQNLPTDLRSRDKAYFFPPPSLICSPHRADRYLSSWIALREAWIFRAFCGRDATPLLTQEWRELLFGTLFEPGQQGSASSKVQQTRTATRTLLGSGFVEAAQEFYNSNPAPISTANSDARAILWELAELNFRFELLSLDRRASGSTEDRQHLVLQCFPGGVDGISSLLAVSVNDSFSGWAAPEIQTRKPYILALHRLIRDWKSKRLDFAANCESLECADEDLTALEFSLIHTYTQTFFDFFGRAPVIPMRLDISSSS